MLPQAMDAVERNPYSQLLDEVVEAAGADYPDRSIRQCQGQVERIINAADAGHYDDAVNWLRRAKEIYLQHQQADDWTAYLDDVLKKHARKMQAGGVRSSTGAAPAGRDASDPGNAACRAITVGRSTFFRVLRVSARGSASPLAVNAPSWCPCFASCEVNPALPDTSPGASRPRAG